MYEAQRYRRVVQLNGNSTGTAERAAAEADTTPTSGWACTADTCTLATAALIQNSCRRADGLHDVHTIAAQQRCVRDFHMSALRCSRTLSGDTFEDLLAGVRLKRTPRDVRL